MLGVGRPGMLGSVVYAGSTLIIGWGAAHLFPTRKVVEGFGPISRDNRLIVTMEWIAEGILLIFAGSLMVAMTARFGAHDAAARTAAVAVAVMLIALAGVSASTGGRVDFIMFRLCAPIFVVAAALILAGTFL